MPRRCLARCGPHRALVDRRTETPAHEVQAGQFDLRARRPRIQAQHLVVCQAGLIEISPGRVRTAERELQRAEFGIDRGGLLSTGRSPRRVSFLREQLALQQQRIRVVRSFCRSSSVTRCAASKSRARRTPARGGGPASPAMSRVFTQLLQLGNGVVRPGSGRSRSRRAQTVRRRTSRVFSCAFRPDRRAWSRCRTPPAPDW